MGPRWNWLSLVIALPLLVVGCASRVASIPAAQELAPPGVSDIRVCQPIYVLSEPRQGGTAVALGHGTFVTCRHNFPVDAPWIYVDRVATPIRVLAAGADARVTNEDWAIFSIPAGAVPEPPPIKVDTARQLEAGQTIYLIGFPGPPSKETATLEEVMAFPRTVVKATVVPPPSHLQGGADGLIFVKAPRKGVYHGMSGGAAVLWDAEQRCWVLVGIYRGATTEYTGVPGLFWWPKKTGTHVIVRFPYP